MTNRAVYLSREHTLTMQHESVPEAGDDEIVVKIAANGICGSDIHFYHEGRLGNFVVDKPYVPGHECSGTVYRPGKHVKGFSSGEKVVIEPGIPCGRCAYCFSGKYNLCPDVSFMSAPGINGTLCDYVSVRRDFVHKIPDSMPLEIAALAEPSAVAVHAVNKAGGIYGKNAVIMGAGPIGLFVLQCFKAAGGGSVCCVDINENKLAMARQLGADAVLNAGKEAVPANSAEVVFETAGSPATTAQLFTVARSGAVVVQVGWPSGNVVHMNIADFIEKELVYTSVNRYANAFPAALSWLAQGRINGSAMISHRFSLEEAAAAFDFTLKNPDKVIKTVITN